MFVSLNELNKINKVQIEILRQVAEVCEKLQIKFFMVHGSLLGTIRNNAFIPFDDDIDIAMKRKDYDRFIVEAPKIIDKNYFVQSVASEENYPLPFAKVRDSRTTYIVENSAKIKMNHGVYIDIFPLDYQRKGKWSSLKKKLLGLRIGCVFAYKNKSFKLKIKQAIAKIVYPSYKKALKKREDLLSAALKNDKVSMTGGKSTEISMPIEWFSDLRESFFEGIKVYIPNEYEKYLTHIYGDYKTRTLVEGKMKDDKVEINACIVDVDKPYADYIKN